MSHSLEQHEALVAALEFVIDGFLLHEIDHWQYRKRVYEVALDALGKPKDENLTNGFYDAFGGTITKTIAENAALKQRIKEIDKRLEFIENNDVYWNMDDPDETGNSPEEIACNNSLDKEAYMKFGGKKYVEGFIAFTATELDDEGNPCDWEPVYCGNEEDAASCWRLSVSALKESQP